MMINLRSALAIATFSVAALALGCSSPPPNEELPGEPVSGKVTVDGKNPNTYATILFVSVSDPSQTATAGLEPSGNFRGRAPLGKCKVALKISSGPGSGGGNMSSKGGSKGPPPGGPPTGAPSGGNKNAAPPKMSGAVDITPKMLDPNKSGVEVEVVPNADLTLEFKK
ncbi:MAG: hypothetical protein ACRC8S_15310 [Fimbriiglobus sp.]